MAITMQQLPGQIAAVGKVIANGRVEATRRSAWATADVLNKYREQAGATTFAEKKLKPWRVAERGDTMWIVPGNTGAYIALNTGTKPHIIGARRLGTKQAFRNKASAIAAVAAFQLPGSRDNDGRVGRRRTVKSGRSRISTRSQALALDWAGALHPTPYAFHPGTAGLGFVKAAVERGNATEVGARTYAANINTVIVQTMRGT